MTRSARPRRTEFAIQEPELSLPPDITAEFVRTALESPDVWAQVGRDWRELLIELGRARADHALREKKVAGREGRVAGVERQLAERDADLVARERALHLAKEAYEEDIRRWAPEVAKRRLRRAETELEKIMGRDEEREAELAEREAAVLARERDLLHAREAYEEDMRRWAPEVAKRRRRRADRELEAEQTRGRNEVLGR